MTTAEAAIASFLEDTVNLSKSSLEKLEEHVAGLWIAVSNSEDVPNTPTDWQQQGSWAYGTIIKSQSGRNFDADIVLEFEDADLEPKEYLLRVNRALSHHGTYSGKTELKSRCVRVNYVGEHHVDLVPLVTVFGINYIVNRTTNQLERAEPVGYAEWFNERDAWAGGQLHKVVRLVKYIRDTKRTHATKSVILTTLLGEQVEEGDKFSTIIEALAVLVRRMSDYLAPYSFKPSLPDPSCVGATFDHRWSQEEFQTLQNVLTSLTKRIEEARAASSAGEATTKWRGLFGDRFPDVTQVTATSSSLALRAPGEELAAEVFDAIRQSYRASIEAVVLQSGRRKAKLLGRDGIVDRHRDLVFKITTDTPGAYEVHWKIRNFGSEATADAGLRGQIALGGREHEEKTLYRGRHYVEAYIVKDRVVVAMARRRVTIR